MSRLKIVNGSEVLITTPYTGTGSGDSVVRGSLIKAPVSIDDVNVVLTGASNDLGTLCKKNDSINWWAKYRPFLANKKKNNTSYCLGLNNGAANGAINSSAEGYGSAIGLDYYGNGGVADIDENYRYDLSLALGTVQVGSGTPSNIHTPVYFNTSTKRTADTKWNVKANSNFDPKFYRLADFNGYCHIAKPKEMCYFSEKISKNYFGIEVSSTASSNPIKEYCLSGAFLFDSSNPTYSDLTLGVLFTEESDDYDTGNSFLINTFARVCYSESYGNGILGSGKKTGSSSTSFYITNFNGSSGKEINSWVLKDSSGYKDSSSANNYSSNPQWVLIKTGNGQFKIEMYPENFPNNYVNWFKAGKTYTVQLVMTNLNATVNNTVGFYKDLSFEDSTTFNNLKKNSNIFSIHLNTANINNIVTGCFCKRGIYYTSLPTTNKVYYDNTGTALNNNTGGGTSVPQPSYTINSYQVAANSNNLIASRDSNITDNVSGVTYGTWLFYNNYDDYSKFTITVSITDYVVPRDVNGVSVDRGITINPSLVLDTTSLNNKDFKDKASTNVSSPFLPVNFSDLFEVDPNNNTTITHSNLESTGTGSYYGTVTLNFWFKFKSGARNLALATTNLNNYTANSSHIDVYFQEAPSVKMVLNIP